MARKLIPLKDSDPIAMRLRSGAKVLMSDGWRGRVHYDDGEGVTLIKDGEHMSSSFKGHRGFLRRSLKVGATKMVSRTQVIDLAARKILDCDVTAIGRMNRLHDWDTEPRY